MFLTNTNMAFSGLRFTLFLTTYTNCPTVKSAGTRYLQGFTRTGDPKHESLVRLQKEHYLGIYE